TTTIVNIERQWTTMSEPSAQLRGGHLGCSFASVTAAMTCRKRSTTERHATLGCEALCSYVVVVHGWAKTALPEQQLRGVAVVPWRVPVGSSYGWQRRLSPRT
ncbi:hypothetical protein Dimus_028837, partial [Dionaea muscipula]